MINFGWEEKELTFVNQFIWWNKLIQRIFSQKILPKIFLKKFSYVLKTLLMYNSHCIFQDMFSIPLTLLSFVLLLLSLRWTKLETTTKLRVRGKKALLHSRRRTQTKKSFLCYFCHWYIIALIFYFDLLNMELGLEGGWSACTHIQKVVVQNIFNHNDFTL